MFADLKKTIKHSLLYNKNIGTSLHSRGQFFKHIIQFYRLQVYVPVCTVVDKNKYKSLVLIGNWPSFQKWYKIFSYPYIYDYNGIKLKSQKLKYFFKKLAPGLTMLWPNGMRRQLVLSSKRLNTDNPDVGAYTQPSDVIGRIAVASYNT